LDSSQLHAVPILNELRRFTTSQASTIQNSVAKSQYCAAKFPSNAETEGFILTMIAKTEEAGSEFIGSHPAPREKSIS